MIRYYCYFGDQVVGKLFKQIIFGNVKLNRLFEDINLGTNSIGKEVKILLRYYIDGRVSIYDQIHSGYFFFNARDNAFVFNFRLSFEDKTVYDLNASFDFLKKTTITAIENMTAHKNGVNLIIGNVADIISNVETVFQKVHIANVIEN